MIKMENDVLSVEIAEHGAELTKLYNKKTGTDLLWEAEPKFWKRHSPVLFPNVGKTYKNTDLARAAQKQREDTQLVFGELGASAGLRVGVLENSSFLL